jgi:trimethylamine:corrinoid methyltransferase-like protein
MITPRGGAIVLGTKALRRDPLAACYINVTNGLQYERGIAAKAAGPDCERLAHNLYAGMPITLAGNMAIWNAGSLVGLVLSQLNREGAPFITSGR